MYDVSTTLICIDRIYVHHLILKNLILIMKLKNLLVEVWGDSDHYIHVTGFFLKGV